MTTIKIFGIVLAFLLVFLVSAVTGVEFRDIMIDVAFIGTINLMIGKWVSVLYMREVMKSMPKDKQ